MQHEHLKISEKVVNMAPELAQNGAQVGSKIDGNRFQDALNKKDEKWSEKSHARVCRVARWCATQGWWGPLNQFIQSPRGTSLGILSLHFVP